MRLRSRTAVLATLTALLLTLGSGAALAGEVKGPPGPGGAEGGPNPVAEYQARSICSFSGLNDVIEPSEPTQTQSYGTFLVLIKKMYGIDAQTAKTFLPSPGDACNPAKGGGH